MNGRITLFELNKMVSSAVASAFPGEYWVEAELMEIRVSRGHCYMELVQKDVFSSALVARASAKCWRSSWARVSEKFVKATGDEPQKGMKLLLRAAAEFHPAYGFALIVSDIDPAYTLGEMAQRRQETIRKLRAEGVYDLQRALALPVFCQHIAVVSSATAAGYGDFCNQMNNNEYGFAFRLTLFPAVMQGEQTVQSVINQLNEIARLQGKFDCVVIIRGGGSTADMSAFDSLELAENVANFPLPVITGIGHERDECVVDLVAFYKAKTPTAVAAYLTEQLLAAANRVERAQKSVINSANILLERHASRLQRLSAAVMSGANMMLERHVSRLQRLSAAVKSGTLIYCSKAENKVNLMDMHINNALQARLLAEKHRLEMLSQRLAGLDPRRMLERGYTLTAVGGHIIKEAKGLVSGDEIETFFADGRVKSIIK